MQNDDYAAAVERGLGDIIEIYDLAEMIQERMTCDNVQDLVAASNMKVAISNIVDSRRALLDACKSLEICLCQFKKQEITGQ